MFDWWPKILPFLGPTWVFCDRYGEFTNEVSEWQIKVLIIGWWHWAIPLMQFDPPRRVESDHEHL